MTHGVEQAFRPAVKLIKKPALAAEVPDTGSLERKDAPLIARSKSGRPTQKLKK
jgi:hypothetical protein